MNIRDLFAADSEEQKLRVDGPTLREVAASEGEVPYSGYQNELEFSFRTGLPGDDMSDRPDLPALNPYIFVPNSELVFLLKNKRDLSAESRARIAEAIAHQRAS